MHFTCICSYYASICILLCYFSQRSRHIPIIPVTCVMKLCLLFMSWRKSNSLNYQCRQNGSLNPFLHIGNLKLLGRENSLSTHAVHISAINYFDDCLWLCNYTFKTLYLATTNHWLAHPTKLALYLLSFGVWRLDNKQIVLSCQRHHSVTGYAKTRHICTQWQGAVFITHQ